MRFRKLFSGGVAALAVLAGAPGVASAAQTVGATGVGTVICSATYTSANPYRLYLDSATRVPAPGGRFSSFSMFSHSDDAGKSLSYVVLRPQTDGSYVIVWRSPNYVLPGNNQVFTKAVDVEAKTGDVIGMTWLQTTAAPSRRCSHDVPNGKVVAWTWVQSFVVGTGIPADPNPPTRTDAINLSATVEPDQWTTTLDSYETAAEAKAWQLTDNAGKYDWRATRTLCNQKYYGPLSANQCGSSVTSDNALLSGVQYAVKISGTASYWKDSDKMCGNEVRLPDGFRTWVDARYMFASPRTKDCASIPRQAGIMMSLDNGQTWTRPTPAAGSENLSNTHQYWYTFTGTGTRPRFRFPDQTPQDNKGAFTIETARIYSNAIN